jgi:hypothetical protein
MDHTMAKPSQRGAMKQPGHGRMPPRSASWLAWGLWLPVAAGFMVVFLLGLLDGQQGIVLAVVDYWSGALPFLAFNTVGALILSRRPHNAIGWLCWAIGAVVGFGNVGFEAALRMVGDPVSRPVALVLLLSSLTFSGVAARVAAAAGAGVSQRAAALAPVAAGALGRCWRACPLPGTVRAPARTAGRWPARQPPGRRLGRAAHGPYRTGLVPVVWSVCGPGARVAGAALSPISGRRAPAAQMAHLRGRPAGAVSSDARGGAGAHRPMGPGSGGVCARRLHGPGRDRCRGAEVPAVRHRPGYKPHPGLWAADHAAGGDLRRRGVRPRSPPQPCQRGLCPSGGRLHPRGRCSVPADPGAGSKLSSIGGSTAAATTGPGASRPSAPGSGTRSIWTPWPPSCLR